MKKTLLFLFICLIISGKMHGQMFENIGTTWYYTVEPGITCFPCEVQYQKLEYIGDTIIDDITCYVISKSGTLTPCSDNESSHEYLYQDASEVKWYNSASGNFTTLYKFDAIAGETWQIEVDWCDVVVTVDSVTYSEYDGNILKNLFVSDENNFFSGKIIENIGNTTSFLPHDIYMICKYGIICDDNFIDGLRCYNSSSHSYNFMGVACDTTYLTSINDIIYNHHDIILYPNPISNYFVLKNNLNLTSSTLQILDLSGVIIETFQIRSAEQIFNLSIKPGYYLYLINTGHQRYVGKLAVAY